MKVTIDTAVKLHNAHAALDGYDRVVKEAGGERVVRETYKFAPLFAFKVAKNLGKLQSTLTAFNKVRDDEVRKLADEKDETERNQKLVAALRPVLDKEDDIALETLQLSELQLDKNPIPVTVLAGFGELLVE